MAESTSNLFIVRSGIAATMICFHRNDLPAEASFGEAVAIDTETLGLAVGRDRLCVVQVSRGDGTADIVQVAVGQTGAPNLERLLADPKVVKLFHYGRFDMAVLHHAFGVMAAPVYCTKIASKIARTYTDRHGLKDLTRELLGVEISKQQQSSDWGADTLSEPQLAYAASDVLHLHALREKLDAMLRREGSGRTCPRRFRLPARAGAPRPRGIRGDGRFLPRISVSGLWPIGVGRKHRLRYAIVAFCRATSRPMPVRASPSIRISSASVNGAPSADPCTSTRPPAPVMTKFASVSAVESSA